jgi:protein-disulfide isomerase
MNRRVFLASTAAFVAAGAAWVTGRPSGTGFFSAAYAQEEEVDTSGVFEVSLGNPDAPVTMIEYASFTCPHCRTFHEGPFKQLKADYIDTGRIHFIYREVYFDRYGLWAAMLARCAGPERYFGFADLIYGQQREWTSGATPADVADNLRRLGRMAGLSNEQVDACLMDGDMARAMVAVYQENAEADEITSTPSFVINGEKYSNMPYAEMTEILDEALGS